MEVVRRGKSFLGRAAPFQSSFELLPARSLCSSSVNEKSVAAQGGSSGKNGTSSALSQYDEQYKALKDLDFMTAAKILFSDPPKRKKFGLDFHLVQLFFVCLPSLAVYLVAQYARRDMKKMDEELELKKQAEFEAKAKEMELKSAEEKAAAASNPVLLEVKERLDKLEETVKKIAVESKELSKGPVNQGQIHINEQKPAVPVEPDNMPDDHVDKVPKGHTTSSQKNAKN